MGKLNPSQAKRLREVQNGNGGFLRRVDRWLPAGNDGYFTAGHGIVQEDAGIA